MKEKINQILTNEKFRNFSKKVFTKRKIGGAFAAIVVIVGLKVGYSLAFEVKGTVMKADSKSIVVRNFLGTKTVNLGDYPVNNSNIVVGERIEIKKNLSGDVIAIRTNNGRGGKEGDRRLGQAGGQGKNGLQQGTQKQGQNGVGKGTQKQGQTGQQTPNSKQAPSGQGTQPGAATQAPADGSSSTTPKQ
jgi:hypothetical protein